jgi:flagellar biosynthesis/type III secretory pathway chaperone
MNTAANDLRAFSESVQATLAALSRLHAAILDERKALKGSDAAQLEQAVQAKLAVLEELTPLLQSRDALQQRLGVPAGIPGGDLLMASAPPTAKVRLQWEELKGQATTVEKANTLNGQLAVQGEKATRYSISLLTGRPTETGTYSRQGNDNPSLSSHTLARA